MEITNPNYNTMPEQVNQNTKDIAVLKNTVKTPATIYNATVEIAQDAGVINQSNITQQVTNTANAFVMDTVGKLFRIVTVENDQVYVAYCASIRGPQGEAGTPGTPGTPADPLTIYPIGSIYMTFANVSPAELFGGQWEQIKDKFLLASGDIYNNGDTGGNATHQHSLSSDNAQAHLAWTNDGAANITLYVDEKNTNTWNALGFKVGYNQATGSSTQSNGIGVSGTTENALNMPPYLVVNVWKRVY